MADQSRLGCQEYEKCLGPLRREFVEILEELKISSDIAYIALPDLGEQCEDEKVEYSGPCEDKFTCSVWIGIESIANTLGVSNTKDSEEHKR